MPMDFPDRQSLEQRAEQRGFRQPHEGETTVEYRAAFADFMRPIDSVEASEVACGVGSDKMSEQQTINMLVDQVGGHGELLKLLLGAEKMIEKIAEEDDDDGRNSITRY